VDTSGRLKVKPTHERVIYHEPCYLGRHNKEYDAPRRILYAVSKDGPLEFALSRDKAMCCGAGGGRMWLEKRPAAHQRAARRAGDEMAPATVRPRAPTAR